MPVVLLLDSGEGGEEKGMVDGREGEGGSLGGVRWGWGETHCGMV